MKKPLIERLEARKFVAPSGCWEWTGSTDTIGYGQMRVNGRLEMIHRISFFLDRGIWPNVCRHTCDNKLCFNPGHLIDGTQLDNMQDAMDRNRIVTHYSDEQLEKVRVLRESGLTYREISTEIGISQAQISRVLRGIQRTGQAKKL